MSKRIAIALLACASMLVVSCSDDDDPSVATTPSPSASTKEAPTLAACPLTGLEPKDEKLTARPAIAVKIENNPVAYPLSGLEDAEVVYEELVEGGITRFMAIYHCTDTAKAGPVRSSRVIDPAIMTPTTRILAAAGGNKIVLDALDKAGIHLIGEDTAGKAMERIDRPGITSEHTLYGDTAALREIGEGMYDKPPPEDTFQFGKLEGKAPKASSVNIEFSGLATVSYKWNGKTWLRFDDGESLKADSGKQISTDNVLIESHTVNYSKTVKDVLGNPSIEIADVTGSGPAVLFRDGRAIKGRWVRKSIEGKITFETKSGDPMVLHPGTTWVELVPNNKGEVKGSFSFRK